MTKRIMRYAGNKLYLVPIINKLIEKCKITFDTYNEPFLGSGAIFYNLEYEFSNKILNDLDTNICLIHNAVKDFSFHNYKKMCIDVEKTFGNIKSDKQAYYNFRNFYNETYWNKRNDGGLYLLHLANSCINSMLRFGPNGMNQSFGNRILCLKEDEYNHCHNKLNNSVIHNKSYEEIIPKKLENTFLFLDPPYELKEMTYNNGFKLNMFLEILKTVECKNSIICYTDVESDLSDELLNYGFKKILIRNMRNISPNRKEEIITKEVMYVKIYK